MMSCEPKHTVPYSNDLRWRMVYQVEIKGKSCREAGENLCVSPSTVCRTVALFNASGNVDKHKHPSNTGTAVLTEIDKIIIIETVLEKPDVLLHKIRQALITETVTCVDVSTIWRFLQVSNFTRQKMVMVAKQRSDFLRAEYFLDMQVFHGHPEMLVFVDETGADRRNCMRRFGYSLRGSQQSPGNSLYVSQPLQLCQLQGSLTAIQLLALLTVANLLISFNKHCSHSYSHLME